MAYVVNLLWYMKTFTVFIHKVKKNEDIRVYGDV